MGSALGKYNRIGAPHDGYPVRAGICYRDLSDIDVEYDCNGSRDKNKWDLFYGERLEPRYIRPMGSALGRYTDKAPPDNEGYPKRAGICYRDPSDVAVEYDFIGSRKDIYVGQYKETEGSTLIRGRDNDEMLMVGIANITIHKTHGTKVVGSRLRWT